MTPVAQVDLELQHRRILDDILQRHLPDREVWAYGSRVSGRSWRYSDLDLVVMGDEPLQAITAVYLREALSESRLPMLVDIADWHRIPRHWRDEILRCYAVIHSPSGVAAPGAAN